MSRDVHALVHLDIALVIPVSMPAAFTTTEEVAVAFAGSDISEMVTLKGSAATVPSKS